MGYRGMLQAGTSSGVPPVHPPQLSSTRNSLPPSHNQVEPPPLNIFQNPSLTSLLYTSV